MGLCIATVVYSSLKVMENGSPDMACNFWCEQKLKALLKIVFDPLFKSLYLRVAGDGNLSRMCGHSHRRGQPHSAS